MDAVRATPAHGARAAREECGPHETADERMARARRQSQRQVTRFQATAPNSAAAMTSAPSSPPILTIPPIALATAADEQRSEQVEDGREHERVPWPRGTRGDERRDRVGRVVQAVGHDEREGQHNGRWQHHVQVVTGPER